MEESADLDVVRVDAPGQARDKRGLVMTSPRRTLRGCMRTAGRAVTGGSGGTVEPGRRADQTDLSLF